MTPAVPALLVAAVGAGVLVGCTGDGGPAPDQTASPGTTSGSPAVDRDTAALLAAHAREVALLAAYDDPLTAATGLVTAADEARVDHLLHLRAIESMLGTATPSPSASPTPPTAGGPADAVAVARALLAAERTAADAGITAVGDGISARIRRLLAEIAASEAQHATALYTGLREGIVRRGPSSPSPLPTGTP
ncbi:MAG TPA: ferritin-like domain-containing protein [Mycobacteriales bacterium]|nr:ferritin-like domain-containing protein [Mycobacteriales bacterium]